MKKLLLTFLSCFCVLQLYAQDKKMAIGVQLTPGVSTYLNSDVDYDPGLYYSAGLTFDYDYSPHLRLNIGVSYEGKGATKEHVFTDVSGNPYKTGRIYFQYNYLSFPVTAAYKTKGERYFYIGGGGFFNVLLASQVDYAPLYRPSGGDSDIIVNTTSSSYPEAGLIFIGGIVFPLNDHFDFDLALRDNLGLSDIGGGAVGSTTNVIGWQGTFKYKF